MIHREHGFLPEGGNISKDKEWGHFWSVYDQAPLILDITLYQFLGKGYNPNRAVKSIMIIPRDVAEEVYGYLVDEDVTKFIVDELTLTPAQKRAKAIRTGNIFL